MASLYIIAGPNGAGKTTFIKRFWLRATASPNVSVYETGFAGLSG